jgi:hypothetical protein
MANPSNAKDLDIVSKLKLEWNLYVTSSQNYNKNFMDLSHGQKKRSKTTSWPTRL